VSVRAAEQIADAVLYEGYVLYPYRASAPKNRARWQIGLVVPKPFAEAVQSDPWFSQTECLAEIGTGARLQVRARALHVQERSVEVPGSSPGEWRAVERVVVDGRPLVRWDEAVLAELVTEPVPLAAGEKACWEWRLDPVETAEVVHDARGLPVARIVRRRQPIAASVHLETEPCEPLLKIRVRVENLTPCAVRTLSERDGALHQSLAGAHTILAINAGAFVSLLDPPPALAPLTASCANVHTFPVLTGQSGSRQVMLSSPIILYDYPAIAPESHGELCDGTEIDELLTLRVRTLTEEEKQEARATDPRAAEIVDRCDAASTDAITQLHGAVRSFESFLNPADEPLPEAGSIDIAGTTVIAGSRVRLQPARVTDSLDICLTGRTGVVRAVYRTLENRPYVAVTVDDDPFGAEGAKFRRALFFQPDELVPLEGEAG